MGLFDRLFTRRDKDPGRPPETPGLVSSPLSFRDIFKNTTVQACANIIANSVSIMPLNLYRRDRDDNRAKATDHWLYRLLRVRPNGHDSPTLFINRLVRHLVQKGNAYIFLSRDDSSDKVLAMTLLNPEQVTESYKTWPNIVYKYNKIDYTERDILHISSLVTDDYGHGIAPVDLARAAVLLGVQLDEFSLSSFGNGLNTKLLVNIAEMTKDIKDEEQAAAKAKEVSDYIRRNYAGYDNAGKPLITWHGMETKELQFQSSNRDAELLESRKWQQSEVAKLFGVPMFLVDNSYDVKYGGLEQAMTVYLNFTLSPYLRHIEQRLNTLLPISERATHYFEFDFHVLLQPDAKSRMENYSKLFQMGAISPAQICKKENIDPPAEAGDTRFVLSTLMPLNQETIDAYMAKAKATAQGLLTVDNTDAAGDQVT